MLRRSPRNAIRRCPPAIRCRTALRRPDRVGGQHRVDREVAGLAVHAHDRGARRAAPRPGRTGRRRPAPAPARRRAARRTAWPAPAPEPGPRRGWPRRPPPRAAWPRPRPPAATAAENGLATSSSSNPIDAVLRSERRRMRAPTFGRKSSSSIACRTRRSRTGDTPPSSLTTRETVLKLTRARSATSRMVGRRPPSGDLPQWAHRPPTPGRRPPCPGSGSMVRRAGQRCQEPPRRYPLVINRLDLPLSRRHESVHSL